MKAIKRITALMLVAVMVLSLSACIHKKNEIAVKVQDVEFTSAYYMCAFLNAYSEAQQKVSEDTDQLTEDEKNGLVAIEYKNKKIEKKKFSDWVEDRAIETLKEMAAYKILCKENKLELTDKQKEEAENTVTQYWDNGYSTYFISNGISRETYAKFVEDNYYYEVYFQSIYGKDGSKEISTENVNKEISDSYLLIDEIEIAYEDDATDDDKAENKQTLEAYAADIKNGKKTFIEIYKAHNEVEDEEEHDHDHEEDEVEPVNTYAGIIDKENTYYDTFVKYEYDVPQVIELEDDEGVALVIKRDIFKDQYFVDYLDSYARHTIADDDFKKNINEYMDKLDCDVSKYAISQFKIDKIVDMQYSY